mgnify:CR=1 FL=1
MVEAHQGAHACRTAQRTARGEQIEMGIVPCLVGRLFMDEPAVAIQFYCGIATLGILIDQEVIFATHQFQVAW